MKFKKEYMVLAAVIIGLVLYLVLHQTDRTHFKLPRVPEVDTDKISRIEVVKPGTSYALARKDDQWFVEPGDFLADAAEIKDMLKVIGKLNITALVSESKNYNRYDLDDAGRIAVKAWTGNTLSREFVIGKAASTYRHTHILIGSDPGVYHAEGNLRNDFDMDIDALRDKRVMNFEAPSIAEIHITRDGKTIMITQQTRNESTAEENTGTPADNAGDKDSGETKAAGWQTADGKPIDESRVTALLSSLSHLKCQAYVADKSRSDLQSELKDPILALTVKGGEHTCSLSVYTREDDTESADFPAISSQNDDAFYLAGHQVDHLTKTIKEMLPDN